MPKDKHNLNDSNKEASEPKKKVVVVEEVEIEDTKPVVEENTTPEVAETKTEVQDQIETPRVESVVDDSDDDLEEKPNYLWIIVPTALLVGALVGGLITYFSGISNMSSSSNVTPTPIATTLPDTNTVTPTATPASSLKKDAIKIQVLNGSGVSGLAGKVKTMLEGLGYKNVVAGNASSSDFKETEVAIKESKKEYLDLIIKDLTDDYKAVEADKPLSATSAYDVVITLGTK